MSWTYTASILSIVATMGLAPANASLVANEPVIGAVVSSNAVMTAVITGVPMAGVLWFHLRDEFLALFGGYGLLALLALTVPLSACTSALGGVLLGLGANARFAALGILQSVLQFLGICAVLVLGSTSAECLRMVIQMNFAVTAAISVFAVVFLGRFTRPLRSTALRALRLAAPFWLHSVLVVLVQRLDVVLLSWFLPAVEVGRCALAFKLADGLTYLPQGLSLALFVQFVRADRQRAVSTAGMVLRILLVANTVMAGVLYFGVRGVLSHFIPRVEETLGLLPLLLCASALTGLVYVVLSCCQALGETKAVIAISATAFGLRTVCLLVSALSGGAEAVPGGLVVAAVLTVVAAISILCAKSGVPVWRFAKPQADDWRMLGGLLRYCLRRLKA